MEIDLSKVVFTEHAIKRLIERFQSLNKQVLTKPEKTARKLLASATEDNDLDSVARVKRLINNNFQEVRYFINSGWRFVIKEDEGQFVVLTIERDTFRNNK